MSAMPKQKSCAVCGETELKRFRVVTGQNVKAWSQLVGNQTLYAGDRICGSHLPIGWKKKAAKFAESSEREERDHHENHQGDSSLMVAPPPSPSTPSQSRISWEHHHHQQHQSVSPNNSAIKFRLHANLKGTSIKFVVPVDPKITVRELGAQIALRYSELLSSKRAVKKVFVYEVTSIEDFSQSALYWKDQLIDVVDNNSLIRFEGRRITGPKGPRKPKTDEKGEGEKASGEDGVKVEGDRRAEDDDDDDDDGVIEEDEEDEEEEEEDEEDEEDEEEQISEEEEDKVVAESARKRKGDAIEEDEVKKKKKIKKNE